MIIYLKEEFLGGKLMKFKIKIKRGRIDEIECTLNGLSRQRTDEMTVKDKRDLNG